MKSMASIALSYATSRIPVFPCQPDKRPYTAQGFKDATTDSKLIAQYWSKWPDAMIGVPTGTASGFWVLDIDAPKDPVDGNGYASLRQLESEHGMLPSTRRQTTPSGGMHYFFLMPKDGRAVRNSAGKVGSKIDVRGDGGYIIIAPSSNGSGAYSFVEESPVAEPPDWLLNMVSPPASVHSQTSPPRPLPPKHEGPLPPYVQAAIDGELSNVATASHGTRNDALNRGAFALGQWVGGGSITEAEAREMLLDAADQSGIRHDDGQAQTLKTIDGGLAKGMQTPRTVPPPKPAAKRQKPGEGKRSSQSKGGCNVNEEAIAAAFVTEHKDCLRFCEELGMWFLWNPQGHIWMRDRTRQAFHYARLACKHMNPDGKPSLGKASTATGVEKFARSDPNIATVSEQWDSDPIIIGTPSGAKTLAASGVIHA